MTDMTVVEALLLGLIIVAGTFAAPVIVGCMLVFFLVVAILSVVFVVILVCGSLAILALPAVALWHAISKIRRWVKS